MLPSTIRPICVALLTVLAAAEARADDVDHLTVYLARTPEREAAFAALRAAQTTPGSPEFHHWLLPAEIGERFGAGDVQLAATTGWLRAQGFAVSAPSASRMFIQIEGPHAAAARAFGAAFSADSPAVVPPGLAIAHVGGLGDDRLRPLFHRRQIERGAHVIAPSDFATLYNVAPVYASGIDGTGVTIGIIGRSLVYPPDLVNFGAQMGVAMPVPRVVVAPVGGSETCTASNCDGGDGRDQGEAQLDLERAGSVAPGAQLELIIAHGSLFPAIQYAVDHYKNGTNASILTISFGACERDAAQYAVEEGTLFQQAEAQGQSVFVSSGDSLAEGCDASFMRAQATPVKSANYLCSSPNVTCVGGTEFAEHGNPSLYWDGAGAAISYIPEGAWNEGDDAPFTLAGTGGGTSNVYPRPAWQMGLLPDVGDHRMTPDIALSAAGHDPYVDCGGFFSCTSADTLGASYGTSAASPSMAGIMALIIQSQGEPQGNINPVLYALAKADTTGVFHDATPTSSGVGAACDLATPSMCNNSCPAPTALKGGLQGYALETGYDEATGLGSVDVAKLVDAWVPNPTVYTDPSFVKLDAGGSTTVQILAHGFGANVDVAFSCGTGLPANLTCTTSGATATIAVAADGGGAKTARVALGLGAIALAGLIGAFGGGARRRRLRWLAVLLVAAHCGGGGDDSSGDDGMMPATTSTNVPIIGTGGGHTATANLGVEAPTAP